MSIFSKLTAFLFAATFSFSASATLPSFSEITSFLTNDSSTTLVGSFGSNSFSIQGGNGRGWGWSSRGNGRGWGPRGNGRGQGPRPSHPRSVPELDGATAPLAAILLGSLVLGGLERRRRSKSDKSKVD